MSLDSCSSPSMHSRTGAYMILKANQKFRECNFASQKSATLQYISEHGVYCNPVTSISKTHLDALLSVRPAGLGPVALCCLLLNLRLSFSSTLMINCSAAAAAQRCYSTPDMRRRRAAQEKCNPSRSVLAECPGDACLKQLAPQASCTCSAKHRHMLGGQLCVQATKKTSSYAFRDGTCCCCLCCTEWRSSSTVRLVNSHSHHKSNP
jgi:hypothetical protein